MNIETYLGFDVGTKRTGVAIANNLTMQAHGIGVVTHHKNGSTNWDGFDKIIQAHTISLFIVGLPLNQNNQTQQMTFIASSFGRKLEQKYNIKTHFVDEYLSSIDAKNQLKYNHYHRNAKRADIDKYSAKLILQTWLREPSK